MSEKPVGITNIPIISCCSFMGFPDGYLIQPLNQDDNINVFEGGISSPFDLCPKDSTVPNNSGQTHF